MNNQNQQQIDFDNLFHVENNRESQKHFEHNKDKFSKQCKIVYEALLRGEKLTTTTALIQYGIGDLRRRVKDLKDIWGVPVESQFVDKKFKEYYLKS